MTDNVLDVREWKFKTKINAFAQKLLKSTSVKKVTISRLQ